jgi:dihydropteroate synthase
MRGTPETWSKLPPLKDALASIRHDLDASVHRAVHAGMDRARLAIDPGLGFGKRKEQNAEILARLGDLASLDLPILVGPSRKSFLAELNKSPDTSLEYATAAAVTAAILSGAHIVRVHDVAAMKLVAQVADQILNSAGTSDSSESHALPPRSGGSPFRR